MFDRQDHEAKQQERIKKMLSSAVRREYLRTRPSFADRLLSGDFFGISIRPDIANDQSAKFINDAEWAMFDAWVDVGHAMSAATRDYGIAHGFLPGARNPGVEVCLRVVEAYELGREHEKSAKREEQPTKSNTHVGPTP